MWPPPSVDAMSIYPKHSTLPLAGQNQAGTDHPQPFSARFASVYRFCIASLWEDPECRPEELENGLKWCWYDKGGQRKTGAVDDVFLIQIIQLLNVTYSF